jgi:L-evernosamine nitrososynthase
MQIELEAVTQPGRKLVALAETLAEDFAERAPVHDREGSYPFEAIAALRDRGYFAAPVPEHLGGLGVASVHDVIVASSRLARGDASVAIGVNMHLAAVLNMLRRWHTAEAASLERRSRAFADSLAAVARERVVMAAAVSEPNQDLIRPSTTATRTAGGWRIDGRKIFCTMSPAATALYVAVSFADDAGVERYGFVQIPTDAPGLQNHDDWDAMGMRASGSHSISLVGVELPPGALRGGFEVGDPVPYIERNLTAGPFHASASLGIAEAAHGTAVGALTRRGRAVDDARTRMLVAENAIDLSACRSTLARGALLIDDHYAAHPDADGPDDELVALFAEAQAAKTFINATAVRVVDRALAMSGGAGYLNGHPLGRAYRDVRGGSFMHPLGANRAYDFIARVALGLAPALS